MKVDNARIYSFMRTRDLVLYAIVLAGLFAVAIVSFFHVPLLGKPVHNWFRYDIPWMFLVILTWLPAFQQLRFRNRTLSLNLDKSVSTCVVDTEPFTGTWKLSRKSPQSMRVMRMFFPIMLLLILGIVGLNGDLLYHSLYPLFGSGDVMKVNSLQGLCEAGMLPAKGPSPIRR